MASIRLENVTVNFPIYDGASRSFRNRLMAVSTGGRIKASGQRIVVNAVDGLSMAIEHGDRVGLIGHNGAGKTTLLRVLAGIYMPVAGRVRIEGKVAPLFDTGFGMDMDATGYENIRVRGLYLGLTKGQLDAKIEEIVAFCDLGPFLNMPLRTYSAGMQTRLAFAVSTSIEPDILLLDEQIGAGDAAFMIKAQERLDALIARSGILVLASHSPGALQRMCTKAAVLEHGKLLFFGTVTEAQNIYAGTIGAAAAAVDSSRILA